jgi:hypothetical protein
MVTLTAVNYSAPSGSSAVGGRFRGGGLAGNTVIANTVAAGNVNSGQPAWLANAVLNTWMSIPGSNSGPRGSLDIYGGWAVKGAELIGAGNGGHGDSSDNGVYSFDLSLDNPVWVQRTAPSSAGNRVADVRYYTDGLPSSKHNYTFVHWVPTANRIINMGLYVYGSGVSTPQTDGWNPSTNLWDPAGTYPDRPSDYDNGVCVVPSTGEIWMGSYKRYRIGIGFDDPISNKTGLPGFGVGRPLVYDDSRDQLFSISYGDGQGSAAGGIKAVVINRSLLTANNITLTGSTALAQIATDIPQYAGLTYDSINQCYWWYSGLGGKTYKITPNNTTTWQIDLIVFTGATLPTVQGSGVNARWSFIPSLKGIVYTPTRTDLMYFLKTAV